MNEDELRAFRTRFGIPISDAEISKTPFYRPAEDSIEIKYMRERREALGGFAPSRKIRSKPLDRRAGGSLRGVLRRHRRRARRRRRWCSCACCRSCCATRKSASWSCRSCPTRRAPSAWKRCSGRSASTRTPDRSTSRSTWTRCSITRKRRTARFSRKGSTKPARCRRSSPPAPPTRRTASTRFRSSSSTRCSDSSGSAI